MNPFHTHSKSTSILYVNIGKYLYVYVLSLKMNDKIIIYTSYTTLFAITAFIIHNMLL